ncbi:hypothetical protein NMG60_11023131 [Bertholletia excelsa]
MERWSGILNIPLRLNSNTCYRVAVSLCISPSSKTLTVPSANAIFVNGDRVVGTGDPVIERLSDLQRIAEILVSKFRGSINAYVVEASTFKGPFAVYKDFIPFVNSRGDPKSYSPAGFPASTSIVSLLSNCLRKVNTLLLDRQEKKNQVGEPASSLHQPKTIILGFSKGGTVLNQLVTELGLSERTNKGHVDILEDDLIVPRSKEILLDSIKEIHYVDVGLNSTGAYITDSDVIRQISERLRQGAAGIRFVLHGTPRQWCDSRRAWIKNEKDKLLQLLKLEAEKIEGKLDVCERFYFADKSPSLQMHFEIIEKLDVS